MFSSLGLAPPKIDEFWDDSARAFTGSFTVLGSSFSFGLPDVSANALTAEKFNINNCNNTHKNEQKVQ